MLSIIFFIAIFILLFIFWCMLKVASVSDEEINKFKKNQNK